MRAWVARSRFGLAYGCVVLVLALAFYREFVLDASLMLYGEDMLTEGYQLRSFGVDEILSGRGFPLWNPFAYGGQPYLAILPGPVFYPTSLLYVLIPLYRAIGWTFVLHTALGGLFAAWAAHALGLRRWASVVTGLSFMFSGFVVSALYGGHDGRMFAMVLIPLAFGCLERGLRTDRSEWFVALGVVVALQVFTPHVQIMYFSSLALSFYALCRMGERIREADRQHRLAVATRLVGLWALAFGLAAILGAAQLLPTYRILAIAVRGGMGESGYAFASSWSLPRQELTALVLPDLLGSLATYWGENPFKLHTEYVGAVPVALAMVAVVAGRTDRRVWFLGGTWALCTLFALGGATPVHRIAHAIVPFVSRFRAPSMMLAPGALMLSLLAGLGWQRVLDARGSASSLPWAVLWAAAAPLLLLGLAAGLDPDGVLRWVRVSWFPPGWTRTAAGDLSASLRVGGWILFLGIGATLSVAWAVARRRIPALAILALVALLVLDLWRVDARYLETVRPDEAFPADTLIEHVRETLEPGERVFPIPERGGYRPNDMMYYRVPSVTGIQKFRLEWYERLVGGLSYANLATPVMWSLLDVRYLVSIRPLSTDLLEIDRQGSRGAAYRVVEDSPHAWFPATVAASTDTAAALRRLLSLSDPRALAVVESETAPPAGAGRAVVERYGTDELTLRVEVERTGLLFVSEIFYPAWRAYIDGVETEILRTNVAFRGVVVPEGTHVLRFAYSPAEFRIGFGLSIGALVVALLWLARMGRSRRRRAGDETALSAP